MTARLEQAGLQTEVLEKHDDDDDDDDHIAGFMMHESNRLQPACVTWAS